MRLFRLLSALALCGIFVFFDNGAVSAPYESIVSFWKMEEASGSRIDEFGGNTMVQTGTVGQATGKVGNAGSFTGGSNYLSINDNASLSLGSDTDLTISVWVYLTAKDATNQGIVMKFRTDVQEREYGIYYRAATDRFVFSVSSDGSNNSNLAANTLGSPALNTWYHIVGWHDANADTVNIQINGGTIDSASWTNGTRDGISKFQIGAFSDGNPLRGRIDAVGLWKRVLTSDERAELYNSGNGAEFAIPYVPGAPTVKRAVTGDSKVLLVWNTPSANNAAITDYVIRYKKTSDVDWITYNDGIDTNNSKYVTGLENGFQYDFQVAAVNAIGQGSFSSTAISTPATVTITTNLISYWNLNETSGSRTDQYAGNVLAETGGAAAYTTGKNGNAVNFTGSSNSLSAADGLTYDMSGDTPFSISAWFNLAVKGATRGIVGKFNSTTLNREYEVYYNTSTDTIRLQVSSNGSSSSTILDASSFGSPPLSTWIHVLAWHDDVNDTLNMQVNNGPVDSVAFSSNIYDSASTFNIGTFGDSSAPWNGQIDDVAIWRRVLTAQERADIYNSGNGVEYPTDVNINGSGLDSSILVQWSSVIGVTGYQTQYKRSIDSEWTDLGIDSSTGKLISGLTNGTNYDVRVRAMAAGFGGNYDTITNILVDSGGVGSYYHHILSNGQSLSIGATGTPALTTTQPYNNKKLTSNTGSFTPLIESSVESMSSALANTISSLVSPDSYDSIVTMHGVGGMPYSSLKKGTAPYDNGQTQMNTAYARSLAAGRPYRVDAVTIVHGESDSSATEGDYQSYLEEWQNDYENDAKALTGQTGTVPLFTDQVSSWTSSIYYTGVASGSALGQLSAARNNPNKIYLVTPKYIFDYNDHAHLTNYSYRRLGEYYGKVMKKVLVDGQDWKPLMPVSIIRNGNEIFADFNVPSGSLAFDTTRVSLKTNYGFEYFDSTDSANISGVEIVDSDTVKITLDSIPTGTNQRLAYAYSATGTPTEDTAGNRPGRDQPNSARGNLRDTDTATALYASGAPVSMGNELYNWSVTFNDPIINVPNSPTGLSSTSLNSSASLVWTAPSDNGGSAITDYVIEYKLSSEPTTWTTFNDGTSTSASTTVTGLTNGSSYDFRVSAANVAGAGPSSSSSSATPRTVPSAPVSLNSTAGNVSVALSWSAPSDDGGSSISDYVIEYKLSSEPTTWTVFPDGTSSSVSSTVTGLTNGQPYDFRVSATNAVGNGNSVSVNSVTPQTIPGSPLSLAASSSVNAISLSWSAPSEDGGSSVTDYVIEYKLSSGSAWTTFNDGISTSTAAVISGLMGGATYDFKVSAVNGSGQGAAHSAVSAITIAVVSSGGSVAAIFPSFTAMNPLAAVPNDGLDSWQTRTDEESVNKNFTAGADNVSVSNDKTNVSSEKEIQKIMKSGAIKRSLRLGDIGADVKELQKFLNSNGFVIAKKGPGSPGQETTVFGSLTRAAVIKYQKAFQSEVLLPVGLKNPTGIFGPSSLKKALST